MRSLKAKPELRAAQIRAAVSVTTLAAEVGVTHGTVGNVLAGRRRAGLDLAGRIRDALSRRLGELQLADVFEDVPAPDAATT
jgi:DNA-binding XRE family transcriptional regulator